MMTIGLSWFVVFGFGFGSVSVSVIVLYNIVSTMNGQENASLGLQAGTFKIIRNE